MGSIAKFRKKQLGFLTAAVMATAAMPTAFAMPGTPSDYAGTLEIPVDDKGKAKAENGRDLVIKVLEDTSFVNWDTFNIGKKESVTFRGEGRDWMVLNRVTGGNESQILGKLYGKGIVDGEDVRGGTVFLVNPAGITFGQNAIVDVGSLVASTLDITIDEFKDGTKNGKYTFHSEKPGVIKNLADITAADDGVVALLAHQVVSGGTVETDSQTDALVSAKRLVNNTIQAGQVAMAAGKNITLELPYNDKISVQIDVPSDKVDFVVNASTIKANKGYVLMQAHDAGEYGKHLVCQMGNVTAEASSMAVGEDGNIVLKAEQVDVGGKLEAKGENAKISILGNSTTVAEVRAKGKGGEINIDTNRGASVVLAGQLYADKKITTKSNHSVIVLDKMDGEKDDTVVSVAQHGEGDGWEITASRVVLDDQHGEVNGKKGPMIMNPQEAHDVYDTVANAYDEKDPNAVGRAALESELYQKFGYRVSSKVINNTLANTNVTIKTDVNPKHYVDYFDHDITVNSDIKKLGGTDTSLKLIAFNEEQKNNYVRDYDRTLGGEPSDAKIGNILLNADIKSVGDKAEGIEAEALNVELTAQNIVVNSGTCERVIETWGTKETEGATKPGSVTINGWTDSDKKDETFDTLTIKSGETTINGDVGAENKLENLNIYAKGNVWVNGSVKANNDVVIRADRTPLDETKENGYLVGLVDKKGNPVYVEGYNVTVRDITAENTVKLAGEENVTIGGVIMANAESNPNAVEIVAQNAFINKAGSKDAVVVNTAEDKKSAWKIYSSSPTEDNFGSGKGKGDSETEDLNSESFAVWSWGSKDGFKYNASADSEKTTNRYIFKDTPVLTYTAVDQKVDEGASLTSTMRNGESYEAIEKDYNYYDSNLKGKYKSIFRDGDFDALVTEYKLDQIATDSKGYDENGVKYQENGYAIEVKADTEKLKYMGYKPVLNNGKLEVNPLAGSDDPTGIVDPPTGGGSTPPSAPSTPGTPATPSVTPAPVTPVTPVTPEPPVTPELAPAVPVVTETPVAETPVVEPPAVPVAPAEPEAAPVNPGEKPQLDALSTTNLSGTASITEAQKAQGPTTERVLGLQSAELPFFNEKNGKVSLYGTYDVSVDPDKVKMEPTAKVLPEPDQPSNQYREYMKRLETSNGSAKFLLIYNGTVLDIYPTDRASEKLLVAGDGKKNEEIESKALFEAFNHMGITLDDLDGVYTHFKPLQVGSFRR